MPVFEYQFGVFVEANNPEEAWDKVAPVSILLDELDVENRSSTEGPWEVQL